MNRNIYKGDILYISMKKDSEKTAQELIDEVNDFWSAEEVMKHFYRNSGVRRFIK